MSRAQCNVIYNKAYCGRTCTVGPHNTPNIYRQNHISVYIETLSLQYQSFLKQVPAAGRTVDGCHTQRYANASGDKLPFARTLQSAGDGAN